MRSDCALIVFAKAPVPGYAKTRLAAALGDEGAALLAERLLESTIDKAVGAAIGPVTLCCDPDARHAAFARLAGLHPIELAVQGEGDLGLRMHRALERGLRTHRRAVLIGTDTPGIDADFLRDAARALDDHDAVFGPAVDGGYTLVGGSHRAPPQLFAGIDWSTPRVMQQTRDALTRLCLTHVELRTLADVDEPADLVHVPSGWLGLSPDAEAKINDHSPRRPL
jgi:rSAM/selenodomain-associated transferase 1